MSPPPPQDPASAVKAQHKRNASGSASPRLDQAKAAPSRLSPAGSAARASPAKALPAARSSKAAQQQPLPPNVHYTLIVRVPFPRGAFQDPPQVEWDANKDKKLWKIISKNSKSADIDWAMHAEEFNVTQPFLLQQAAWLYERHFQGVKAQMNRLRTTNAPTPPMGSTSSAQQAGGIAMQRTSSGRGIARAPSALSGRSRESPLPHNRVDPPAPGTPRPNLPSRTPSTRTITQSGRAGEREPPASPRQPVQRSFRGNSVGMANAPAGRKLDTAPLPTTEEAGTTSPSPPASDLSSSESSSEDDDAGQDRRAVGRSQLLRRPPAFNQRKTKNTLGNAPEEESDEDSPTFLPFANAGDGKKVGGLPSRTREDPSATLRSEITPPRTQRGAVGIGPSNARPSREAIATSSKVKGKGRVESSASSAASSSAPPPSSSSAGGGEVAAAAAAHRRVEALSPRHRAELARLSPRRQGSSGAGGTREGSEGTPSMGSSFSDLDDTSITQSALEEALASNFRHGGASRLSTISHAFGSRLYNATGGGRS